MNGGGWRSLRQTALSAACDRWTPEAILRRWLLGQSAWRERTSWWFSPERHRWQWPL